MTSLAPGQLATPRSLLDAGTLAGASDVELMQTVAAILAVQHERALTGGDIDAMVENAFLGGFTSKGEAGRPWVEHGLLICPGSRKDKSATSHDCTYVSVEGEWAFATGTHIADVSRQVPGPRMHRQSITVLPLVEGCRLDLVTSAARSGGPCEMKKALCFQVRGGALVEVSARARKPDGHR